MEMEMLLLMMIMLLFPFLVVEASSNFAISKKDCSDRCGNVSVPYPFGIGRPQCAKNESFFLNCNQTGLFFMQQNIPVYNISLDEGTLTAGYTSTYECYNNIGNLSSKHPRQYIYLLNSSFTISPTSNKVIGLGCDTLVFVSGLRQGQALSGCLAHCNNNTNLSKGTTSCSGAGCCQTLVPDNIRLLTVTVSSFNSHKGILDFNPCSYAFVAENGYDVSTINLSATVDPNKVPIVPMVLEWVVGDRGNCQASEGTSGYSCSVNADCSYSETGGGSICSCRPGFTGNPYLPHGCQDIDECSSKHRDRYPCHGTCKNIIGDYTCRCPLGMHGDGKVGCRGLTLTTILAVIGVVIMLGIVAIMILYVFQKRKKEEYFRENGGMILKHQRIRIFSEAELEKATNNYDSSRLLGEGGFGSVYKGFLADNMQIVAIKKPKRMDKATTNQEFQHEMGIVSQVNHKNVVKILGLCLETKVPLLVYEFVSNGTLYHHIHDRKSQVLKLWKNRLKIASEIADALNYLHSLADPPIIHGDVKSMNILLDDHYTAKVADFGASVLISPNKNLMGSRVHGTLGYLDPEYLMTGDLTEKSDVYSFAVVLVELLTKEKPSSCGREGEKKNLVQYFLSAVEDNNIIRVLNFEPIDDDEKEEIEAVAKLVKRCLNSSGLKRPAMREVAEKLGRMNESFYSQQESEELSVSLLGKVCCGSPKVEMDKMESYIVHSTFDDIQHQR